MRFAVLFAALVTSAISAPPAFADQEASNTAHVVTDRYGRCYARATPAHDFDPYQDQRQQGRTQIYRTQTGGDVLVHEYDWFAQQLFVRCGPPGDEIVVRLGPWHRGRVASEDDLAIAFYRAGALLRSYSTLEISGGAPDAISNSVSHYTVFTRPPRFSDGYGAGEGPVVVAETVDGRSLRFDAMTGELL